MSVDVSKIKPGDEVLISAVVAQVSRIPTNWRVRVHLNGASDYSMDGDGNVRNEAIVSHTPKDIAVGDRVKIRHTSSGGDVIAIRPPEAWVEIDSGGCLTYMLSSLERVND